MTVDKLEREYAEAQQKVIRIDKWTRKRFIGRFFIQRYVNARIEMQDIFRDLREETRRVFPERFL
jgi:hypothetical protein